MGGLDLMVMGIILSQMETAYRSDLAKENALKNKEIVYAKKMTKKELEEYRKEYRSSFVEDKPMTEKEIEKEIMDIDISEL